MTETHTPSPAVQRTIRRNNLLMWLILAVPLLWLFVRGKLRGIRRIRNIAYVNGGGREQQLDVYVPVRDTGTGPSPIVLYVHGGGFVLGSRGTHLLPAYLYARYGYLVFNISYRTAPVHRFPTALEDCADAYAWVRAHAAEYGGDTERMVIAGESAGGNLTACLMLVACYRRPESWAKKVWESGVPAAVQIACGYLQVTEPGHRSDLSAVGRLDRRTGPATLRQFARAYLGSDGQRASDENLLADPVRFAERGIRPDRPFPHIWLPVGSADILTDDSKRMYAALQNLGAEPELVLYPGEQHGFHMMFWRPRSARQYWRDCFAFLSRCLQRKGGAAAPADSAGVQPSGAS